MKEKISENLKVEVSSPLRTGMITSISLFLGFALVVLRMWGHGPGPWRGIDYWVVILIGVGILLLLLALYLVLIPKDLTLKCFRISRILLFSGVCAVLIGVIVGFFDKS
jgi:hypothetical protein